MNSRTIFNIHRSLRMLAAAVAAAILLPSMVFSQSPLKVNLRSAGDFVIIAATTITSTGGVNINGNVALTPGSSMTGFPPGVVTGQTHINDQIARDAQIDLTAAYNDAAGRPSGATLTGNIGGQTLAPGVYKQTSSLLITSGDLTLDAQGDPNAVWIFQIATTLTTGTDIVLKGGAQAKNIFWQVGTSATLGSGSIFYGDILAHVSITMNSTVIMVGRSLASTGAVTANGTGATNPDSLKTNTPVFTPIFNTASHIVDLNPAHVDSSSWTVITIANTGTANLVIGTWTSSKPLFSSHLSGTTVTPGATIKDTIKFSPTTMGADSGFLYFTHNAATSPDTIKVRGNAAEAKLSTASRNVNVGGTRINTPSWTLVTITNTGNDTLRITRATSTNTVFSSRLSSVQIAPGASIVDSIMFLPTNMGADSAKLIFISNARSSPDTISLHGIGKAAILGVVSRNLTLGTSHVGTPLWTLVTLSNSGNDTLRVTAATSTNSVFSSHLTSLLIPPGGSVTDSIQFLPTTVGAEAGTLIFASNATTSPDTIAVFGTGTSAVLVISARSVNCGTTQVGTLTWTVITLYNTGNEALVFTTSTSTNSDFSSHLSRQTIPVGGSITDSIKFIPSTSGSRIGQLIFASNAVSSPDAIAVYGNGIVVVAKTAILSMFSRNIDCGTTPIGRSTLTLLTLVNTGDDTLRFTSSTSTSALFTSSLSAMQIAPGAAIVDSITFLPTAVGGAAGQLRLISNAVNSPDTIHVYGVGIVTTAVDHNTAPDAYAIAELYPNPFADATQLHVQLLAGEQLLHAGMYDMLGRELQNWTTRITPNGTLSLHLGYFPKGEYLVRLLTTQRTQVLPMLIVK